MVEHVNSPRQSVAPAHASLKPGGVLICSTQYHGYHKNCALALSGKLDAHFTALWDGGHIKFWSRCALTALLQEAGFQVISCRGAGRWPWLWKWMLAARKPLSETFRLQTMPYPLPPGARLAPPAPAARVAQPTHGSERSCTAHSAFRGFLSGENTFERELDRL